MKKTLQIQSKKRGPKVPKWIPPEKRMKTYEDFGVTGPGGDITKVKFTKFRVVVPTEEDRKQLQAAFEYFHDNPLIDTEFVTVNQLAHSYLDDENVIVVDEDQYRRLEQATCNHLETHIQDGIKYCKQCWKALQVTSYRD